VAGRGERLLRAPPPRPAELVIAVIQSVVGGRLRHRPSREDVIRPQIDLSGHGGVTVLPPQQLPKVDSLVKDRENLTSVHQQKRGPFT
jgi:hypothetical protein